MIAALLIKMIATAVVVIGVTVSVAHLGPRLGGIIAGLPIVLGPAFFFLGREQSDAFVGAAAVSTLHALTATLMFITVYVVAAGRLGALGSLAVAVLAWGAAALLFTRLPGGYAVALAVYLAVFAFAALLVRRLRLPQPRARTPTGWPDLLLRGVVAGVLVGVATTVGARAGPAVSGTMTGFPVGFLVITLTLHQRFGAGVSRATLATAQRGMLSLVAFAATVAALTPVLGGAAVFYPALGASLGVSALLLGVSHLRGRTTPQPMHSRGSS